MKKYYISVESWKRTYFKRGLHNAWSNICHFHSGEHPDDPYLRGSNHFASYVWDMTQSSCEFYKLRKNSSLMSSVRDSMHLYISSAKQVSHIQVSPCIRIRQRIFFSCLLLPVIQKRTLLIFKIVEPNPITNHNFMVADLWYQLSNSMAVITNTKILYNPTSCPSTCGGLWLKLGKNPKIYCLA